MWFTNLIHIGLKSAITKLFGHMTTSPDSRILAAVSPTEKVKKFINKACHSHFTALAKHSPQD